MSDGYLKEIEAIVISQASLKQREAFDNGVDWSIDFLRKKGFMDAADLLEKENEIPF